MSDPILKSKIDEMLKGVSEFENFTRYVAKYEMIKKIAKELKTSPELLINFAGAVGSKAIGKTIEELKKDLPDLLEDLLRK